MSFKEFTFFPRTSASSFSRELEASILCNRADPVADSTLESVGSWVFGGETGFGLAATGTDAGCGISDRMETDPSCDRGGV